VRRAAFPCIGGGHRRQLFTYASKPWTVQFDADLQSPPEELHRLIDKALEGYHAVFAVHEANAVRYLAALVGRYWLSGVTCISFASAYAVGWSLSFSTNTRPMTSTERFGEETCVIPLGMLPFQPGAVRT
jgi:hypothetical protein